MLWGVRGVKEKKESRVTSRFCAQASASVVRPPPETENRGQDEGAARAGLRASGRFMHRWLSAQGSRHPRGDVGVELGNEPDLSVRYSRVHMAQAGRCILHTGLCPESGPEGAPPTFRQPWLPAC